jgi:hypothetical protein
MAANTVAQRSIAYSPAGFAEELSSTFSKNYKTKKIPLG